MFNCEIWQVFKVLLDCFDIYMAKSIANSAPQNPVQQITSN